MRKHLFLFAIILFSGCTLDTPDKDKLPTWSTTIEIPIIQTRIDLDTFLEDSLISVNEDSIYVFNKTEEIDSVEVGDQLKIDPIDFAIQMKNMGAGELLVNSVDKDGTMEGYDIELIKILTAAVNIPVVACGGAGSIEHFKDAINKGGASAVAAGSMFVFYGRHRAVLISYPNKQELDIFNLTPSL